MPRMVRRPLLWAWVTVALWVLCALGWKTSAAGPAAEIGSPSETAAVAPNRPNVILILADDLDERLHTLDYMPFLRTLVAQQGTTFTQFLANCSLCCPSRTTLLRGQYVHNHTVYTNGPPDGGFEKAYQIGLESSTLATVLQSAGYRTALMGKYLNGYPITSALTYVPPGWSEWYSPASDSAYSNYNYTLNMNGTLVPFGNAPEDYLTDVISRTAVDFVTRTVAAGTPFFLYVTPYVPHLPATPAPRHAELFPDATAPRLPSFNEADVSDKPWPISAAPLLTPREIAEMDAEYRRRLQCMQAVDEMIRSLVQTLEQTGQLANTFLFFTSDNGYHMGEHRLPSGKYWPYEEDVRVPLVVRGPDVPAGATVDALAGMIDLLPTVADLAGVGVPEFADGRSLAPYLRGAPPAQWRQVYLLEQYPYIGQQPSSEQTPLGAASGHAGVLEPPDPDHSAEQLAQQFDRGTADEPQAQYFGLRGDGFKYVEYRNDQFELYDLERDPFEQQNAYRAVGSALRMQLAAWLQAMATCAGEGCRQTELAPPPTYSMWLPVIWRQ